MSLGSGPLTSTIEVAIYQSAIFDLNFNRAIVLSIIQILICGIFLLIGFYKQKGSNFFEVQESILYNNFKDRFIIKFIDYIAIYTFFFFIFSNFFYNYKFY